MMRLDRPSRCFNSLQKILPALESQRDCCATGSSRFDIVQRALSRNSAVTVCAPSMPARFN
jgi:hypothetical protein